MPIVVGRAPQRLQLWKPENVTVARGKDKIGVFEKTEKSQRQFCQNCGGHVMTAHPGSKIIDVYAAMIPDLAFAPALHVNYAKKVLPVVDGLPKFKAFPSEDRKSTRLNSSHT